MTTITRTPVKSTNIQAVGYDAATKTLEVQFSAVSVYRYAGVPQDVYEKMLAAESVGRFFAEHVRTQFKHERMAQPEKAAS